MSPISIHLVLIDRSMLPSDLSGAISHNQCLNTLMLKSL